MNEILLETFGIYEQDIIDNYIDKEILFCDFLDAN